MLLKLSLLWRVFHLIVKFRDTFTSYGRAWVCSVSLTPDFSETAVVAWLVGFLPPVWTAQLEFLVPGFSLM